MARQVEKTDNLALALKDGGEIELGEGVFSGDSFLPASAKETVIRGRPGFKTTFNAPAGRSAFNATRDNDQLAIFGVKFDGSAVLCDRKSHLHFEGNDLSGFQRGPSFAGGSGLGVGGQGTHSGGWQGQSSVIKNNIFHDAPGGWGITAWRFDGLEIIGNDFMRIGNGIKCDNGGAIAYRLKILANYMADVDRMWAEMQGQVDGFELAYNFCHRPVLSTQYAQNINDLGWSVIYHGDKTRNVLIHRNYIYVPERPDGTGVRICFEAGNGAVIEYNYCYGTTFAPVFMGDSSGLRTREQIGWTYVRNNQVVNPISVGYAYGQYPDQCKFENNTGTVQLPWDTSKARLMAGTNRTLRITSNAPELPGGGTTIPTDPPPPVFSFKAEPLPATSDIKTKGAGQRFTFSNAPAGTSFVRIRGRARNSTDPAWAGERVLIGGTVVLPYEAGKTVDVYGWMPAWEVDNRIEALSADRTPLADTGYVNQNFTLAGVKDPDGTKPENAQGSALPWPPKATPTDPQPPTYPITKEIGSTNDLTLNGVKVGVLDVVTTVQIIDMKGNLTSSVKSSMVRNV